MNDVYIVVAVAVVVVDDFVVKVVFLYLKQVENGLISCDIRWPLKLIEAMTC